MDDAQDPAKPIEQGARPATRSDVYESLKRQDLLYHKLLETGEDGIMIMRGTVIVDVNERFVEIVEIDRAGIIGKAPWQLGTPTTENALSAWEVGKEYVRKVYDGEGLQFIWEYRSVRGTARAFNVNMARFDLEDGPRLLCRIVEATENLASERQLRARNRFQSLLSQIAGDLIASHTDHLPAKVSNAMRKICDEYRLERATIFWAQYPDGLSFANRPVGFGSYTTDFIMEPIAAEHWRVPWTSKRLQDSSLDVMYLPDELPPEAEQDRAHFREAGIKSQILVPLHGTKGESGAAAVSTLSNKRDWTVDETIELPLLLQTVGFAWVRYVQHFLTAIRERDLLRSQRVAEVGSFQILPTTAEPLSWDNARVLQSDQSEQIRPLGASDFALTSLTANIHKKDRDRVIENLTDLSALDSLGPLAYRIRHADGSVVHVEERFEVDRDKDHSITRVFGTIMNVTELVKTTKKLSKTLAENEQLRARLQAENIALRDQVRVAKGMGRIIGSSPALRSTLTAAEKVAQTHVPVLILGETGTGKELLARAIHKVSERRNGAMVSVNCAVISTELIESELFGHEKGAFTDASTKRQGRFELADGGTLFLDEIGELPPSVQAKLLRVLQNGEFQRLGGNRTIKVDVRLLAATNRNLEAMVESGEFRSDLLYRINQFPVTMPPLRERREDIPALVNHLVQKHAVKLGKGFTAVSPTLIDELAAMDWPGNVRELEGVVQRCMIACDGPTLDIAGFAGGVPPAAPRVASGQSSRAAVLSTDESSTDGSADEDLTLVSMQKRHISAALAACDGRIDGVDGAAALLGLPPSSLRSKMKRLRIDRMGVV